MRKGLHLFQSQGAWIHGLIAMFLIATQQLTSEKAMAFIKQKRPIAFYPSANFGESIRGFEESLQKNLVKNSI